MISLTFFTKISNELLIESNEKIKMNYNLYSRSKI